MDTELRVWDETVRLNGLRFHYRDWDEPTAPAVVLLYGFTGTAHDWDTIARGLADRYRVLALDQRGFGESAWASDYHEQRLVDDLGAFVDHLGVTTFAAVGFSGGGTTAGSYAAREPGRVTQLVLAECFGADDTPALTALLQTLRARPGDLRLTRGSGRGLSPLGAACARGRAAALDDQCVRIRD
jgi:pimeloyl-ACP methyl ester carboxylesterase